jgi:hypothetical protein
MNYNLLFHYVGFILFIMILSDWISRIIKGKENAESVSIRLKKLLFPEIEVKIVDDLKYQVNRAVDYNLRVVLSEMYDGNITQDNIDTLEAVLHTLWIARNLLHANSNFSKDADYLQIEMPEHDTSNIMIS